MASNQLKTNASVGNNASSLDTNKVMNLNIAINEISSVLKHAQQVLDRITEAPSSPEKEPDQDTFTLAMLMCEGPEMIRNYNSRLHDIINNIETHLF